MTSAHFCRLHQNHTWKVSFITTILKLRANTPKV